MNRFQMKRGFLNPRVFEEPKKDRRAIKEYKILVESSENFDPKNPIPDADLVYLICDANLPITTLCPQIKETSC